MEAYQLQFDPSGSSLFGEALLKKWLFIRGVTLEEAIILLLLPPSEGQQQQDGGKNRKRGKKLRPKSGG